MALSSISIFIHCLVDPLPRKQTSKTLPSNHIDFKSAFNVANWSINQTLVSPLSAQCIHLTDEDVRIKERRTRAFKHILRKEGEGSHEVLAMIDAIQRLGIDHHFQDEIDEILQRQYTIPSYYNDNDLHGLALRFRLLRQGGYNVSAGVFDKFKDKEGNFDQKLSDDIRGLMELYEASQLSIGAEDHILDEAGDYSHQLLSSWMTRLDDSQARIIKNTLDHPHHKNLARFRATNFNRYFHMANIEGWMNELQELAKIDFQMVQSQNQQEIFQVAGWWKDLGISKELKFVRNQPLKWYIWSMATLSDPSLSQQRIDLTKPISFIYIIDDIFDVQGSLDELTLFTEIVKRWDVEAVEQLPGYMRACFKALDSVTNEIGYKVYKQHGWNPVHSLRETVHIPTWASLCKAFLVEARWFASGHLPAAEEYLQNGIVSSGVHVVLVHIFYLLGHGVTREGVDFIGNRPAIITSTATILRLWDDLGISKDENQDGHDGSYVECYVKEHKGSLVEIATKKVTVMISDAWKQLNQECLHPNPFSPNFTKSCLNLARMVPLMYSYDDNHRLPVLEYYTKSLLFESVSI
eukprot:XP_025012989.1 probable terpene synthase 13 isoform X1 [Ricinus communis]